MAHSCAILDDYQNIALSSADWSPVKSDVDIKVFNAHLGGPDQVIAALKDFAIVVAMRERTGFPKQVIDALPNLKLLITTGMRNASIDTEAAKARGVTVCGTGAFGSPTSGIAIGLMLELTRHIGYENARLHAGATWQSTIGPELEGLTLGVLGLGKLGQRTAAIAKAFGMKVIAWSQNLTPEKCAAAGVGYVGKDDLFRQSDFISIHVVLSQRSRGLVGAKEIGLMKPTRRRCLRRCATSRSPAPGLTCSTSSRCRSIIRCARWTTSSSPRISAMSRRRTTGTISPASWKTSAASSTASRCG
jgi:phosphoglycerate dehydrogenase-like enzyme